MPADGRTTFVCWRNAAVDVIAICAVAVVTVR